MGRITDKVGRLYTITGLNGGIRRAGMGIEMDDYSEESGNPERYDHTLVRMPHDGIDPESLNGPVIIIQEAKK